MGSFPILNLPRTSLRWVFLIAHTSQYWPICEGERIKVLCRLCAGTSAVERQPYTRLLSTMGNLFSNLLPEDNPVVVLRKAFQRDVAFTFQARSSLARLPSGMPCPHYAARVMWVPLTVHQLQLRGSTHGEYLCIYQHPLHRFQVM